MVTIAIFGLMEQRLTKIQWQIFFNFVNSKTFSFLFGIVLLFCATRLRAQNLVPNPSFEDTVSCPTSVDEVYRAVAWSSFGETPDYFNSCGIDEVGVPKNELGYRSAATGHAYCG